MRAKDVFGIVVRVFGVSLSFYSLWYILYGIALVAGLPVDRLGDKIGYPLTGIFFLASGLYLLRGAPGLMKFCYPENTESKKESEQLPAN